MIIKMNSTVNFPTSPTVYRNLEEHEQQQVLNMWYSIFKASQSFHERCFSSGASLYYQDGDIFSAWYQVKLMSIVYIRRLIV